jgi:hypothetical protein
MVSDKRMLPARAACTVIVLLVFAVLAVSCSTEPTHYRGSLSDAMDKSRDDYEGDRSVPDIPRPTEQKYPGEQQVYGTTQYPESYPSEGDSYEPTEFWLGLRGGNGYYDSRDMEPLADGDIMAGGEVSSNLEVDLFAGFKVTRAVAGSALDESVKDSQLFLKAGLEGRYSPLPGWPVFSPYLSAGLGAFFMGWNFRNALSAGDDIITSDSITGLMVSVGAGMYLLRLEHFRVGISVQPEMYLFGLVTAEGFDNDYFDYYDAIKYVAEIAVKL